MVKNFEGITGVSGSAYAAKNSVQQSALNMEQIGESKRKMDPDYIGNLNLVFLVSITVELSVTLAINHPNAQVDLNIYTLTEKGRTAKSFGENIPRRT